MDRIRVGINGFGRVGRIVTRIIQNHNNIELVGINDLADLNILRYLLKYDSTYGQSSFEIATTVDSLFINGKEIQCFQERNPDKLPWKELGVGVVIESTGLFRNRSKATMHLNAGAKKVIVTAPSDDADVTIVIGVNDKQYKPDKHEVISLASCTTNALAPIVKILNDEWGILKGFLTTIHAYTNDQVVLDAIHKDPRRARTAAVNMIPTSTGAASTIRQVLPELDGLIDGIAIRVPTPSVSLIDFVAEINANKLTPSTVNNKFEFGALKIGQGIFGISYEPLVSTDYIGDPRSSVVDALSTMVIGDNMVKILAWYDNEFAYSCRIVDMIEKIARD